MKRRSAAISSSACEPPKDSIELSPNNSEPMSSALSFLSDFLEQRFLWAILVICSSVNEEQIVQEETRVTHGSSPLPASLQVGQKLCVSNGWQK